MEPVHVTLEGGSLVLPVSDWDGPVPPSVPKEVTPFAIDRFEVTWSRYAQCVHMQACRPREPTSASGDPATGLSAQDARALCEAFGGRLPHVSEWIFAAAGTSGRRYPWGNTGAVCRRGAWGLLHGPCATGVRGPLPVGVFEDGRTPEGVYGLADNVSEWVEDDSTREPRVAGGTWKDDEARALRSYQVRPSPPEGAALDIGFRCAYPLQ